MASRSNDHHHLLKLVLIGDTGVGKSCFLLRFADDSFTESYITTIGVDFRFRTIQVGDEIIKLQIWDTAGQERFRTITSAYYRGANGVVIVYDTTDKGSFDRIDEWVQEVDKYASKDTIKLLVGNKCDMSDRKAVSLAEAEKKAKDLDVQLVEVSAKTGVNVEEAFHRIAYKLVQMKSENAEPAAKLPKTITAQAPSQSPTRSNNCGCN